MRDLQELLDATREHAFLTAALRVGILDAVAERPYTERDIARITRLKPESVRRLVAALVAYGIIVRTPLGLALSAPAKALYGPKGTARFLALHSVDVEKALLRLPRVLESGQPVEIPPDEERLTNYVFAMRERPAAVADRAATTFLAGLPPTPRILDVGGGPGHMSRRFAAAGAHVTLLDLPEVVEIVGPGLRDEPRIRLAAGDATESLPDGPWDGIYMGFLTNLLGPDENAALLARAREVLRPGGRLGIVSHLGGRSPGGATFSVLMMVYTERGDAWSGEHYAEWARKAGLEGFAVHDLDAEALHQLVLAERPA